MERNGAEHSIIFRLLTKSFDLGLRIPKLKILGFRESYCMASGKRIRKRTGRNSPFCSISFRVLVTTILVGVYNLVGVCNFGRCVQFW